MWKGFGHFYNLEYLEKGRPFIYKLEILNGELRVFLPQNTENQETLGFLLKNEDFIFCLNFD